MQITPTLGTSGIWSLSVPFASKLQTGVPYTLIAVRRLTDILKAGGDPETDYYLSNAVATSVYLDDLRANGSILSLQGKNGSVVYVPNSFVNNYPDIGGAPYRVLGITVNVGAIPDTMSLATILTKIQDDVKELIGVTAIAKIVALSPVTLINSQDAAAIESARQANIGTNITDYTRYVQASRELVEARDKIMLLELLIKKLHEDGVPLPVITMPTP